MSSAQLAFKIPYMTVSILLDMSAIFLNGLIAYLIKKHKRTSLIPFWFIYCLSICDTMVGLTGLTYHLSLSNWTVSFIQPTTSLLNFLAFVLHQYFLQISGQLIVIIAFDRYMNMRFLKKYSRIMTKARARLTMLLCIVFGTVFIIPIYTLTEERQTYYDIGINAVRAAGTQLIYVIYIKTYITIRRRYSALQTGSRNQIAPSPEPERKREDQSQQSSAEHCNSSFEAKVGLVNNSLEKPNSSLLCSSASGVSFLAPQDKAFTLPQSSASSSMKLTDTRARASLSHVMKNGFTNRATESNVEVFKVIKVRQVAKTNGQCAQLNQKLVSRMPAPEQDFLKAVLFIFLALFICYLPFLCYMLYTLATKDRYVTVEAICLTIVLLNSSLNAVILIAFSKDMRRSIKAGITGLRG